MMRTLSALLLLHLCAAPLAAEQEDALRTGRELTTWLYEGRTDTIAAVASDELVKALGGAAGLERFAARVLGPLGPEKDVVEEAAYAEAGLVDYYRIARFGPPGEGTVTLRWVWRVEDGAVVGLRITPTMLPAATEHADHRTRTLLHLPFNGFWNVAWGGRAPHQNYHVVAGDQRFAYDFLIRRDGSSHLGAGAENKDYFCWRQPVLAPAGGTVTSAVDSIPDNEPGEMNAAAPAGNHVVIHHGNGEYSLLAHLRHGTVRVRPGDAVNAGETLGECGNSGNSSEPHLHYHLQTGPAFGQGVGLPAFFVDYSADGRPVPLGEPLRGETVGHSRKEKR